MALGGVGRGGALAVAQRYRFDCFVTNPNRPEKRNAMSPQVCFDMVDVPTRLDSDPETKVLVLTGAGEAFRADMDDKPVERAVAREADRHWGWDKLSAFSKPTVAMVNGHCFGGAFIPLCACDFAIAADAATFGLSEVNWRILPTAPSLRAVEIGGLIAILLPWERMDGVR